jgi:alkanesulfonate monooxygenase SsuD/methylene tetrahydromethanopterin reductase-like flavin-dependent oxidoreductase (luciferase family)
MRRTWDDAEAQVEGRPDAEAESVSIITMHSAKGLEWPIVIPINSPTELHDDDSFLYRRSDDTVHFKLLDQAPAEYELVKAAERDQLAVGIIPGTGWRASEIQDVARAAEESGFEAIFCTEVNNDSIATAQWMGASTRQIKIGTWVTDIYLRVAYLCAKAAIMAADATGGRFILGLGVSHQPVNRALGIDMPDPTGALRTYTVEVAKWLRGEGPPTHLLQQPSPYPVPIYLAALTSQNVELAGEIADGVMPLWWSVERVARSKRWIDRGRAKSGGRGKLELTLGLPTYIGDDIDALRAAARMNLGFFTGLPFFQRLMRASGFITEADMAEQGAGGDALSDRLLDAICLLGPVTRCRERLAEYREAGLDLPILWPAIGVDSAREVIGAFRQ